MQLHELRGLAHTRGLTVLERGNGRLLVTNGGTAQKGLREALVDTVEEALALVMGERNGRATLLLGKHG